MNRLRSILRNKYGRLIFIAALVMISDQITKAVIVKFLALYHKITIIPGFFDLTHIQNPGGAFGFLAGQSSTVRQIFFVFISFLAICLIFHFYRKIPRTHPLLASSLALVFGGAVGNLIDRIRFGKVVDFLDLYIGSYHWPAFNVADSAISIGMVIFVYHLLFSKMPE